MHRLTNVLRQVDRNHVIFATVSYLTLCPRVQQVRDARPCVEPVRVCVLYRSEFQLRGVIVTSVDVVRRHGAGIFAVELRKEL